MTFTLPTGIEDRPVAVIGAGTLGRRIALMFAGRGGTVRVYDTSLAAIKREALAVVADGVSTPQDVDRMWQVNTGTRAGPFRMMDRVGLDVVLDIENHYAAEHPELPTGPRELLKRYVDAGHLGVKTGRGFYDDYDTPS